MEPAKIGILVGECKAKILVVCHVWCTLYPIEMEWFIDSQIYS
jgi:hypothetical protein